MPQNKEKEMNLSNWMKLMKNSCHKRTALRGLWMREKRISNNFVKYEL